MQLTFHSQIPQRVQHCQRKEVSPVQTSLWLPLQSLTVPTKLGQQSAMTESVQLQSRPGGQILLLRLQTELHMAQIWH